MSAIVARPLRDQVLELTRDLEPSARRLIEAAFDDAARLSMIRDMFLEGRDLEGVALLRELDDQVKLRKVLPLSSNHGFVPMQSELIVARPQLPFTPTALVVSALTASNFLIGDVRVSLRSQFVAAGDVPADLAAVDAAIFDVTPGEDGFLTIRIDRRAERQMGLPIDMPEVMPGQEIAVVVTHVGLLQDLPFHGAILGSVRTH